MSRWRPAIRWCGPGEAYFLHSYAFLADDPATRIAVTDHGGPVTAAIGRDNLLGVQFHPRRARLTAWPSSPASWSGDHDMS